MKTRLHRYVLGLAAGMGIAAPAAAAEPYYYYPAQAAKPKKVSGFAPTFGRSRQSSDILSPTAYYPSSAPSLMAVPNGHFQQAGYATATDPVPVATYAQPGGHGVQPVGPLTPYYHSPVMGDCEADCEPECESECYWYAGGGVYYVKPSWETNPAFLARGDDGDLDKIRQEDFSYTYEIAPRVWIGAVKGSGIGVRARGWYYEQDAHSRVIDQYSSSVFNWTVMSAAPLGLNFQSIGTDNNPTTLNFESDLNLAVVDLDGTWAMNFGGANLVVCVGARYADISQSYNATEHFGGGFSGTNQDIPADIGSSSLVSRLRSGNGFTGFGPTAGIDARYDFCFMNLAAFGGIRGAVLFGHGKQEAFLATDYDLGEPSQLFDVHSKRQDVMPVFEFEAGVEWTTQIADCKSLFLQGAVVSHTWFGAGNGAQNEHLVWQNSLSHSATADNGSNLGLFGVSLTGGIRY